MKNIKIPSHPDVAAQIISSNPMAMIAFQHVMLQSGIVPITTVGSDVNKLLKEQGVSEEDQRTLKRKFRKLWRTAAKRVEKSNSGTAAIREAKAAALRTKPVPNVPEAPVPPPNRFHKEARKALVFMTLRPQIQALGFDERFRQLWRFYLAYCQAGFISGCTDVMQFELGHPR